MTRFILVILTAATLAACGDINVAAPKGGERDQGGGELDQDGEQGSSVEAGTRPAAPSHPTAAPARPEVSAAAPRVEKFPQETAPRFDPTRRGWAEAVTAAPAGYRLATRAELTDLIDDGVLEDLDLGGNSAVWTASHAHDETVWMVGLDDGRSVPAGRTLPLAAVYVVAGGRP